MRVAITVAAIVIVAKAAFAQTPLPNPTPTLEERKAAMMERFRAQQAAAQQARIEAEAKAKAEAGAKKQKEEANTVKLDYTKKIGIHGIIIQRTDHGVLVRCDDKETLGNKVKGSVWVENLDAPEEAHIDGFVIPIGTYSYTTVSNAERVADNFYWVDGRIK